MSEAPAATAHTNHPIRAHSEGDIPDQESPTYKSPGHAPLKHVASYTFGSKKFGGRSVKKQWKFAALKTKELPDPWVGLGFGKIKEEVATRHMYNPRSGKWKTDRITVKMQSEPFAHGAMRECYRMKKLSKFVQHPDWNNASNYVAKCYMKEAPRDVYFEDVKLQMDSKLWGEKYNQLTVPKKVDFFQTYIIELQEREGSPLYAVEHFIEGGYIKYNSNSGFVSDINRLTPQTFSHFTFEKSNHQLIVVDIQGVGDLYTDPQMHTVDQKEYGEANLGTRGMALFFSSHVCGPLCEAIGLSQFDLSEKELGNLRSRRWNFSSSTTKVSDLASSRGSSDREEEQQSNGGSRNNLLAIKTAKLSVSGAASSGVTKASSSNKETVGEAFSRLRRSITPESLKNFKDKKPTNINVNLDLHAIPESPLDLDSPLPFDSPLPLDSPLPFDSIDADTPSSPTPGGNGSIMMKIPVIVEEQTNGSDAASKNENENKKETASDASSGNDEESGGEEADVEDSNDSEVPLSATRDDEDKKSRSKRIKGHPSPLSLIVTEASSSGDGSRRNCDSDSRNDGSKSNVIDRRGGGGLLRVYDSGDDSSYHSASVEKERTRLREEGKEDVGREEKDALRILGMIHWEMGKYHEAGRFSEDLAPDMESALYHLKKAARGGVTDALYTLAHIHLQQPHDDFKEISMESSPANECLGMDYLVQAAERGMKLAMLEVAKAFDSGFGLGKAPEDDPSFPAKQRTQDYSEAVRWYQRALEYSAMDSCNDNDGDSVFGSEVAPADPDHSVLSRMAEMYRSGGPGLEKDPQRSGDLYTEAAEAAMNAMKGKLANKFYMLAEEAWGEVPEDEEV